jgi:hypothetical protein
MTTTTNTKKRKTGKTFLSNAKHAAINAVSNEYDSHPKMNRTAQENDLLHFNGIQAAYDNASVYCDGTPVSIESFRAALRSLYSWHPISLNR